MTIIAVLDGPEKAGKTTLAHFLAEGFSKLVRNNRLDALEVTGSTIEPVDRVLIRHWHGQIPSTSVYLAALIADTETDIPVIWDRSWVSEAVYSVGLDRPDRGNKYDWFSTAWYYGRAIQTTGLRLMVLGPSVEDLKARRTPDDLPIDPQHERELFGKYAEQYNWIPATGNADQYSNILEAVAAKHEDYLHFQSLAPIKSPKYCGPLHPKVVFIGEAINESAPDPSWLPFTSHYTTKLGRAIMPYTFRCGWTNATTAPTNLLSKTSLIVACGHAANFYLLDKNFKAQTYSITHPSALYRWGRYAEVREEFEVELRQLVGSVVGGLPIS
jgi:thymidylate kinase